MVRSVPQLIASAHGLSCEGPHACLLCGAPASHPYALPDTFTARHTLASPGSGHCCAGCLICQEEVGEARYSDGTAKAWARAFRRTHSWTVTPDAATPHAGPHLPHLRRFLLEPPAPPWGACLVGPTNGRHMLYMTPINLDPGSSAVLVEGERVRYDRASLRERLRLTLTLASIGGLPSLDGPPSVTLASAMLATIGDAAPPLLAEWGRVHAEPLSRLAVWLTPKREECPSAIAELG